MKNQIRNEREDDLVRSIVVNIAVFKGITHNKLVEKISEETSIKGKKTISNKMDELIDDDLIETRKGKGGTVNYYLKGMVDSHNINYDPKFNSDISLLLKDIDKIKNIFPSLDEESTFYVSNTIEQLRENCSNLIRRCKNDTDYNRADSLYEDIKERIEGYSNSMIEAESKNASEIHKQIKDLEAINNEIIDKLRRVKTDPNKEKLAMNMVENYKTCKHLSNQLGKIRDILPNLTLSIQEGEFRKVLRSLDEQQNNMTRADLSIRTLQEARLAISEMDKRLHKSVDDSIDSILKTEVARKSLKNKINDIFRESTDTGTLKTFLDNMLVGLLREHRKPIPKDLFVTELQKTGMFPNDDAYDIILHMFFKGEIWDSQNEIFIIPR